MITLDEYSDDQIMQEMLDFFASWRPEDVRRLSQSELSAWKKHAIALRQANFWWVPNETEDSVGDDGRLRAANVYQRGTGWPASEPEPNWRQVHPSSLGSTGGVSGGAVPAGEQEAGLEADDRGPEVPVVAP